MRKKSTDHSKIFISHTSVDKPIADALVRAFKETLFVRQDERFFYSSDGRLSINSGQNIVSEVVECLKNDSACVIALLTDRSYQKPWLHFEAGGALTKNKLISVLLPSCPPDDKLPLFFTWGLYHNLRTLSPSSLEELFNHVATNYFSTDPDTLNVKKQEFSRRFFLYYVEKHVDEIAALCIKQDLKDKEPRILLVKNKTYSLKKIEKTGTKRHFPKYDAWLSGRPLPEESVATICAYIEAGVSVLPVAPLGKFIHLKTSTGKEKTVLAYAVEYIDEHKELKTSHATLRRPKWFTQSQALAEVSKNRPSKYVLEYKKMINIAFAEWSSRRLNDHSI